MHRIKKSRSVYSKILSLAVALTLLSELTGCGNRTVSSVSDSDREDITVNTVTEFDGENFIVGFDAKFPPYGYLDDNGEYTGLDLDLAEEVCSRNGWKLTKQPIDWDLKDQELSSGAVTCVWNGFTMTDREEEYTWTEPYMDSSIVVVVSKDSNIYSLADLTGKNVTTQTESSGLRALTGEAAEQRNLDLAAGFAQLMQTADYNAAFEDLESGKADAVVVDIGAAYAQIEARGDVFRILDEKIAAEQYAVGFLKGNDKLCQIVQDTLFDMYEDGSFMKIVNRYSDWGITQEMVCLGGRE